MNCIPTEILWEKCVIIRTCVREGVQDAQELLCEHGLKGARYCD